MQRERVTCIRTKRRREGQRARTAWLLASQQTRIIHPHASALRCVALRCGCCSCACSVGDATRRVVLSASCTHSSRVQRRCAELRGGLRRPGGGVAQRNAMSESDCILLHCYSSDRGEATAAMTTQCDDNSTRRRR